MNIPVLYGVDKGLLKKILYIDANNHQLERLKFLYYLYTTLL